MNEPIYGRFFFFWKNLPHPGKAKYERQKSRPILRQNYSTCKFLNSFLIFNWLYHPPPPQNKKKTTNNNNNTWPKDSAPCGAFHHPDGISFDTSPAYLTIWWLNVKWTMPAGSRSKCWRGECNAILLNGIEMLADRFWAWPQLWVDGGLKGW